MNTELSGEPDDVYWPSPPAGLGWYKSHVTGRVRYFDGEEWLFWSTPAGLRDEEGGPDAELYYRYGLLLEQLGLSSPVRHRQEYARLEELIEAEYGPLVEFYPDSDSRAALAEIEVRAAVAIAAQAAEDRENEANRERVAERIRQQQWADFKQVEAREAQEERERSQQAADAKRSSRRGWIIAAVVVGVLIAIFVGRQSGVGATARCADGSFSYSQHASGTCSWHGGVAAWTGDGTNSAEYKQGEQEYLDEQNANR